MNDFPKTINSTPVEKVPNSETDFRGEVWITLRPIDEEDDRLWEFSLTTGELIQTM